MRALIVEDGNQRGALSAARALGRAGWTVGVGSPKRGSASRSRWTRRWHEVPPPIEGAGVFEAAIVEAIADGGYDVIFGSGDSESMALARIGSRLDATVGHPAASTLLRAYDKARLTESARRVGIPVPSTSTRADDPALTYPVVVKQRLHGGTDGTSSRLDTATAATVQEAETLAASAREDGVEVLFQDAIDGNLMAYVVVADGDHKVIGEVTQRAIGTFPPGAGVSVRAVTVETDPELAHRVHDLISEIEWWGVAELQFLVGDDGSPKLIDLNGRFYGSLALAIAAGIDVPGLCASIALDGVHEAAPKARVGVRYQWLEGDLRRARVERTGGLLRDVWGCLRFAPGATHSLWSPRDPWPAIAFSGILAGRALRKAVKR